MAPGAQLYLICIDTEVDLGDAKDYVKANGITIVNHSVGWFNSGRGDGSGGPLTPDGIVADARANGILWVNSAGNSAQEHWSGTFSDTDGDPYEFHNFAGPDNGNTIFLATGQETCGFLKWDAWPTTNQDFDLFLFQSSTGAPIAGSANDQSTVPRPPTEGFCFTNTGSSQNFFFGISSLVSIDGTSLRLLRSDRPSARIPDVGRQPHRARDVAERLRGRRDLLERQTASSRTARRGRRSTAASSRTSPARRRSRRRFTAASPAAASRASPARRRPRLTPPAPPRCGRACSRPRRPTRSGPGSRTTRSISGRLSGEEQPTGLGQATPAPTTRRTSGPTSGPVPGLRRVPRRRIGHPARASRRRTGGSTAHPELRLADGAGDARGDARVPDRLGCDHRAAPRHRGTTIAWSPPTSSARGRPRTYAENEAESPAVVVAKPVVDVGVELAELAGTVDPRGNTTHTLFEWGTTTDYGNMTPETFIGSNPAVTHRYTISGLSPGTTYHFRIRGDERIRDGARGRSDLHDPRRGSCSDGKHRFGHDDAAQRRGRRDVHRRGRSERALHERVFRVRPRSVRTAADVESDVRRFRDGAASSRTASLMASPTVRRIATGSCSRMASARTWATSRRSPRPRFLRRLRLLRLRLVVAVVWVRMWRFRSLVRARVRWRTRRLRSGSLLGTLRSILLLAVCGRRSRCRPASPCLARRLSTPAPGVRARAR